MPTSLLNIAPVIVAHVWEVARELDRPIRILDVGPGFGRYGLLCRELVDGVERGARISRLDAIEAEPRYVARFPWLDAIYDEVFLGDVTDADFDDLFVPYDLVLMLDVIEHIDRAKALALLDRIPGRVLISTPRDYFDNPEADAGWPTERHRSHFPTAESFGDANARVERVEAELLDAMGANIVRLAPRP